MIKIRNKRIALLLVLAMLATMFVGIGTASAADPVKVSSSFSTVIADDNQLAGVITVQKGDKAPVVAGQTLYVTIDLPSTAEWVSAPLESAIGGATAVYDGIPSKTSVSYTITTAVVDAFTFTSPRINIDSATTGNIVADVSLVNLTGDLTNWSFDASPVIAKVGSGELTATAAAAKNYGSTPLSGKFVADITVKENQADVFATGDTVSFSIANSGVTFASGTVTSTNGLTFGAVSFSSDKTVASAVVNTTSAAIGGRGVFSFAINADPSAADGDITFTVSSDNSDLTDTDLVVANIGTTDFTVTTKDVTDRNVFQGRIAQKVGDLVIDPSGTFTNGSAIQFTMTYAKWNTASFNAFKAAAPAAYTVGSLYGDSHSFWITMANNDIAATQTISLPTVNVGAAAPVGDLIVTIDGSAGVTGDYAIATVVAPVTATAPKLIVNTNALDQVAGDIKITELQKNGFVSATGATDATLVLTLPNGVTFSAKPTAYLNGSTTKIDGVTVADNVVTIPYQTAMSSARIDYIDITGIKYDVDERWVAKDIVVKISGHVLTDTNGSTDTITTVANATGMSTTSGSGSFTIGSTAFLINGVVNYIDPAIAAPYVFNNRVFLPIRFVAYAMGINPNNVMWDQVNQSVTLVKGDKVVQVKLYSNVMLINGVAVAMDVAPQVKDSRVMLPIRFIAQAFGATVTWNPAAPTVVSFTY